MSSMIVRTAKLSDGELLDLLTKLFELLPGATATISLPLGANRHITSAEEIAEYSYDRTGRNIQIMNVRLGERVQETVIFQRGVVDAEQWRQHPNHGGFGRRQPSAYFDEVGFFPATHVPADSQPLGEDAKVGVAAILNSLAAPADVGSDDEARALSKVVSKQIDDLRKLNLEMTRGLAEARQQDLETFAARQVELDASFKARLEEFTEKEAALERRREELNDREPQHERRRLREHLTERLQSTIAEPPQHASSREWWSNIFYLAVGAVFVAISIFLAAASDVGSAADGSAAFWAKSIKSLVSGIAGAAFAWAGLAGLKSSARGAREYEQHIQRYAFDMDRASWVVETLLQMNAIEKTQIPDEWLEAVCRDLFAVSGRKTEEARSLDSFAALFDATAKARIGTSGVEFEIDRKGARKLAHDAAG